MIKLCRVIDHQKKSGAYRRALEDAGYEFTERENVQGTRFILSDADWRTDMMVRARGRGVPVFLYPHAARPMVIYDGCVEPQPVRCMFTHAPGGAELMKRIGYPYPVEAAGWSYSDIFPFCSRDEVGRVLFAPIHPNGNGWLSPVDKDLNWRTFVRLEEFCRKRRGAQLSVRVIGSLEACGLAGIYGDVEIHQGKKNNSTEDMMTADVVAAHQTFAYLAVALGIPTVMMGEDVPPRSGNSDAGFCYVQHWDDYKDELMYPLDILNGEPDEVIGKACAGCPEVEDWKVRLIGQPFDGPKFVKTLESYL